MAFVVVQHLAPRHESLLPALLARTSNIDVVAAVDGMRVEPNQVYVIPPNADLAILQGVLHVMTPPRSAVPHGPHLPIDYFFRSLAADQGPRSIGIVLSGTGQRRHLRPQGDQGGGRHHVRAGAVDARSTTACRAARSRAGGPTSAWRRTASRKSCKNISEHPYLARTKQPAPQTQENVAKLVVLMRAAFGNDLSYYKPTTVDRRIERRMALHKIEKLSDYIEVRAGQPGRAAPAVQGHAHQRHELLPRHGAVRGAQDARCFPRLLENKDVGSHLRIWVPACSTGEEAYSIAIALLEYLGERAPDYRLQMFGTDVDEASIQHARRGVYPPNIALDVSPERLQRFFVKKETEYQVARRIRDMVVFSNQNVTKDAPFSRLDLVTCRNLLIYLRPGMQKKVLRILHYALLPAGFLMLGDVGDGRRIRRVFLARSTARTRSTRSATSPRPPRWTSGSACSRPTRRPRSSRASHSARPSSLATVAERKILELYGPPGVVINEDLDIIHIRGRTGPYLEPMPGAPSFNILRLARPELHVDLRRALHEAKAQNQRDVGRDAARPRTAKTRALEVEVVPIVEPDTKSRCFLRPVPRAETPARAPAPDASAPSSGSPEDERRR